MGLIELYVKTKKVPNNFFKNKKCRIMFGPAKGLTWVNDDYPNLTYNLGIWEPYKQFRMTRYIKKGMVAYDVGAFHGYFTLVFSRLVGEQGFVYAFEPARENFAFMENVITLNKMKNVELHQKAVGARDGVGLCDFDSANPMGVYIDGSNKGYKVDVVTLDCFAFSDSKRKPDIIKLDIEGLEFEALKAMEKVIKVCHPAFFIDVHNEPNHHACIKFLGERGYKVEVLHQKAFPGGGFLSDIFASVKKTK